MIYTFYCFDCFIGRIYIGKKHIPLLVGGIFLYWQDHKKNENIPFVFSVCQANSDLKTCGRTCDCSTFKLNRKCPETCLPWQSCLCRPGFVLLLDGSEPMCITESQCLSRTTSKRISFTFQVQKFFYQTSKISNLVKKSSK